jgi:hypothetical protein
MMLAQAVGFRFFGKSMDGLQAANQAADKP